MSWAQFVVGPPGSGKTTYCQGISQFYKAIGRKHVLVNLDFANDSSTADIDVRSLIALEDIMETHHLGPNGALLFGMEYLDKNLDWLDAQLEGPVGRDRHYVVFDCPGQVELYILNDTVKRVIDRLVRRWDLRACCVTLVDATLLTEPTRYISMLLVCLQTMLHLSLPHVNVLSKADLLKGYNALPPEEGEEPVGALPSDAAQQHREALGLELPRPLESYTQVIELDELVDSLDESAMGPRFRALNRALCELVEDFGLVSFQALAVEDKASMLALVQLIDRTNGYYAANDKVDLSGSAAAVAALDERVMS